jgi:hypothetical protein
LQSRRSKLVKFERQRSTLERRLTVLNAKIASLGGEVAGRGRKGGRVHNARSLPETITHVLTTHGKPIKVSELVKAVLAGGYKTHSANFRGIVNQALIKDKRFVATERGIYTIKK